MSEPTGSKFATRELDIERRILRARAAAVDALDQGNWDAVVLSCGKVLQEVARAELPYNEHSGTLPQLLERLGRRLQTDQPVTDLAAALKDAGGLRGFFDLEADVDEELARATLSVIESFLTYTYAFREEVRKLNELVASRREGVQPEPTTTSERPATPADWHREGQGSIDALDRAVDEALTGRGEPPSREREEREPEAPPAGTPPERRAPSHSVFDRFDERNDDPIRQTWRPPRSED